MDARLNPVRLRARESINLGRLAAEIDRMSPEGEGLVPDSEQRRERLAQFGNHLRRLREHAGLTQQRLAEKAGVQKGEVGFFERGQREPGITTLWSLAEALGIPLRDILPPVGAPRETALGTPPVL